MQRWIPISEAIQLVAQKASSPEQARTELRDACAWGEIPARAESYLVSEKGKLPHRSTLCELKPQFWQRAEIDWLNSSGKIGDTYEEDGFLVSWDTEIEAEGIRVDANAVMTRWPDKETPRIGQTLDFADAVAFVMVSRGWADDGSAVTELLTRLQRGELTAFATALIPLEGEGDKKFNRALPAEFWVRAAEQGEIDWVQGEYARDDRHKARSLYLALSDINTMYPPPERHAKAAQRKSPGAPQKADWAAITDAYLQEVKSVGFPDRLNEDGWQTQADVQRWIERLLEREGISVSETTLKDRARRIMEAARQQLAG